MGNWKPTRVATALTVLTLVGAPLIATPGTTGETDAPVALDYAFRFASAIHTDRKDMGKAQESVVLEYANAGRLDDAVRLADDVTGWRQGTVYADLAAMLADEGRHDDARRLIPRARAVRASIDGWQTRRIDAHLATALAKLGERDASAKIVDELAEVDPRQYSGRAAATIAAGVSRHGDYEAAMAALEQFKESGDYEIAWWRTLGYLEIARSATITEPQRRAAMEAAEDAARRIRGWKAAEALQTIADRYAETGRRADASRLLADATDQVTPIGGASPIKHVLLSRIARSYGRIGKTKQGRELLAISEREIGEAMVIDRPGLYGEVAAAYHSLGDADASARVYDVAFGSAEGLVNARPRALSIVHICRTMGRDGIEPSTDVRARLDALYSGLRAPW